MYDPPVIRSVSGVPRADREEIPPTAPLLIISPHFDDAALSCSALLERSEPAEVLTVFSGEPQPPRQSVWDRRTGFADSAASMAARREEDRRAFAGSPHTRRDLDLLDYEYAPRPRPASDRDRIGEAVEEWARTAAGGVVAVPAGAGRRVGWLRIRLEARLGLSRGIAPNPDHLLVRDAAAEALSGSRATRLLLYEELPYALDGSADRQVAGLGARLGAAVKACAVEIDRDRKAGRIAAYESQIASLHPEIRLDRAASLPPAERYWYLDL